MLSCNIEVEGKTLDEVVIAIKEALYNIENGSGSGFDESEDSSYSFSVSGEEEDYEH